MSSDINGQLDGSVRQWKRYPAYKDSGIVWFGDVPDHWNLTPLGYSVRIVSGSTPSKDNPAFWNGDVPWVSPKDMKQWEIVDSEDHITQEAVRSTTISLIKEGSVLIVIRGMILARDVPVAVTKVPVTINQDMKALRPRNGIAPEFLAHQIRGLRDAFHSILEESAHGTKCLRTDLWTKLNILVPPEDEQRAICGFIHRRAAKIDALIAKKERLIELLQERRTALISHSVTKGLDATVPMQESGVRWLGEIPAHWDVIQSRRMFRVRNEPADASDRQLTASQKYGVVYQSDFVQMEGRRVVETIKGVDSLRHVEPGDFVISLRSFQGGIEWCRLRGSVTFHYVVLKPVKKLHPPFFGYLFKSTAHIQALRSTTDFIRDGQDLRYSHFVQIPLPVIPLDEQVAVAAFLDRETSRIDSLINEVQHAIELLREYRTALISAAVTGKIDVREEGRT